MSENIEYIQEFTTKFDSDSEAKNDEGFISAFIEYANHEDREWRFGGENNYCGFTAMIADDYSPLGIEVRFEIAYYQTHGGHVGVFTPKHNGFWVPEYIKLKGGDAKPILDIIKSKLLSFGGF